MFANVEREVVERVLALYAQQSEKQVFIAFDRVVSKPYRKLVDEAQVLYLSRGGNELFGKAWNRKKEPEPEDSPTDASDMVKTPVEEGADGQLKLLLEKSDSEAKAESVHGKDTED